MKTITLSFDFPATYSITVPGAQHLPADKKEYEVDMVRLAKRVNSLSNVFGIGLVRSAGFAGALSEKDYPQAANRAKEGRVKIVERFDGLYEGVVPTGGGGATIPPKVAELRKMVVVDHKANGVEFRGKVVDIKHWTQCDAIASTMVRAIAKLQKATLTDDEVSTHVATTVADWTVRIDAILTKQRGATPLVLTPDEVPAESTKS